MQTTRATALPADLPFGADDPRALFGKAVALATAVIAEVRPEQMDGPTPCTEMDVRQVLGHLVGVLWRVAALGRDENPFAMAEPEAPADDGWLQGWLAAAHQVQAAWTDDAVLKRGMTLPWIQAPGAIVLTSYVGEITIHTWDLATATAQVPAWDPQVLEVAYAGLRGALPAEGRTALFEAVLQQMPPEQRGVTPPFGEVVPTTADAPLIDRLVAWTGRRP